MTSTDGHILPDAVAAAIAAGVNAVKVFREARRYSIEDMAVTCGLSVGEITSIKNCEDADPGRLRRIAAALRLPETALLGERN
jgi:transcriptional regulator with XRE-family HTH domain